MASNKTNLTGLAAFSTKLLARLFSRVSASFSNGSYPTLLRARSFSAANSRANMTAGANLQALMGAVGTRSAARGALALSAKLVSVVRSATSNVAGIRALLGLASRSNSQSKARTPMAANVLLLTRATAQSSNRGTPNRTVGLSGVAEARASARAVQFPFSNVVQLFGRVTQRGFLAGLFSRKSSVVVSYSSTVVSCLASSTIVNAASSVTSLSAPISVTQVTHDYL